MTGYVMIINEITRECLVSSKKDFSTGSAEMYLDDVNNYYSKVKVVPRNEDVITEYKKNSVPVNSNIKDFHSNF